MKKIMLKKHRKGDTWRGLNIQISDENKTLIDVSNNSYKFTFRSRTSKGEVAKEFLNDEITKEDNNIVIPSFLMDFDSGFYVFDMQETTEDNVVTTLFTGTLEVIDDIS